MTRACLALIVILSLFSFGCEDTDVGMALQAGADAVRAVTLDDEGVHRLAVEVATRSDREHSLAPPDNPHAKRLERLTGGQNKIDGYEFDFKVYLSPKVNAFAMADGTIRIYSGLMEMMTDGELLFVIGHEIGHVVENHIKEKHKLAYAGSAVRKAIASQQNEVGDIARSAIGALTEKPSECPVLAAGRAGGRRLWRDVSEAKGP
jgi:putative metalloprotease